MDLSHVIDRTITLKIQTITRIPFHKELDSGVGYCIKADRCVRVQHEEQGGKLGGVPQAIVCVTVGLAALCHVLHVFSNVVHVGDVRPLLRVRVDAHIYQVPQLVGGKEGG